MNKFLDICKSVRFQQLFIGLVLIILGWYGVIDMELAKIIAGFFGISVAVGTVDGFAKKK